MIHQHLRVTAVTVTERRRRQLAYFRGAEYDVEPSERTTGSSVSPLGLSGKAP